MSFHPNAAFYDRIATSYDAIAHSSERESTEQGLAALAAAPGESALEIGYGTGHAISSLARAVGDEGKVAGVDVSEGMQGVTERLLESEQLDARVDLRVGAVPPLEFGDGEFDAVFLSFTLELFPDDVIGVVTGEVKRVLKPGGRCGLVTMAKPRTTTEDTPLEKAYVWMHRHFPHIVDCRPIDAEDTLAGAGLEIVHAEHHDIWSLPVAIVVGTKPE